MMLKELERAFEMVRQRLPQIFEEELNAAVRGAPKEFCVERETYIYGEICRGYMVGHEEGRWGITMCAGRAGYTMLIRWGDKEKRLWNVEKRCRVSYEDFSNYKSPLDLFHKVNRIFRCALEQPS